MFLAGIGVFLVFEGAERGDDAGASFGGLDDRVDVAALGGNEGIGKAVAEFGDFFLAKLFALGFGNFVELALVDDIYGAFRTHDGDLRGGPGEIGIGSNVFRSHDAISPAVGFAGDDRDFRDSGLGEGEEQFGAVLDDSAEFLLSAGEKTWNIFEGDERNVEGVAETHETRALHRGIDIENAGEEGRLIANDAGGAAVEARKSDDEIFRIVFMHFEEVAIVNDGVDSIFHVVGLLGIGGNEGVE